MLHSPKQAQRLAYTYQDTQTHRHRYTLSTHYKVYVQRHTDKHRYKHTHALTTHRKVYVQRQTDTHTRTNALITHRKVVCRADEEVCIWWWGVKHRTTKVRARRKK